MTQDRFAGMLGLLRGKITSRLRFQSFDVAQGAVLFDEIDVLPPMDAGSPALDLADEFTKMITAQRGFQASARVITVSDQFLDEVVALKR